MALHPACRRHIQRIPTAADPTVPSKNSTNMALASLSIEGMRVPDQEKQTGHHEREILTMVST
jgi:hypothetical protein